VWCRNEVETVELCPTGGGGDHRVVSTYLICSPSVFEKSHNTSSKRRS